MFNKINLFIIKIACYMWMNLTTNGMLLSLHNFAVLLIQSNILIFESFKVYQYVFDMV